MKRQPVITGLGIVSPIGIGVEKFWAAALAGRSGISTPTLFDASKLPPDCRIVGEVRGFNPLEWMPAQTARTAGRFTQFGIAAARMARKDSALDSAGISPEDIAISTGTTVGGQMDVGEASHAAFLRGKSLPPWTPLEYPPHAATGHIAIDAHANGQAVTFSTACAAGLDAIGWAQEKIRRGGAKAAIAGGTETPLSAYSLMLFHSVGVLSKWPGPPEEASRPFDQLRSGLVLAEGAAIVVIEDEECARARGAQVYARILGFSSTNEGTHLRKVEEGGETVANAIALALDQARMGPSDIDYICAHGNSMPDYDTAETAGIKRVFRARAWNVPVSSLKSMCGQALAASSAMQVVAACLAIRDGIVPPTINYRFPDPGCDLDYVPNTARTTRIRASLIHAHSLGGSHVTMVLGAPD